MPKIFLDSHVHFWPGSDANASSHAWMKDSSLAKQYSIKEYLEAISPTSKELSLAGLIYVETDRRIDHDADGDLRIWAAEPLKELGFLKRIVEGVPNGDEGFQKEHSSLLKAIVAWAPFDRGLDVFLQYLAVAKDIAGEATWSRIKGLRFLLQGIREEESFRKLFDPESSAFVSILRTLGTRDLSFDVGVDQRQGGVWQLEHFAATIEQVHKDVPPQDKTIFILNHLCKPNMEQDASASEATRHDFERWAAAITRMANQEKVYMKLSGAFSEIADQSPDAPLSITEVVDRMTPWLNHIFDVFGPQRIMFGSDWPVCNVRGPGDAKSWPLWADVVQQILQDRSLSKLEVDRILRGTAVEAYRLGEIH